VDELVHAIERVAKIDGMACRRHVEERFTMQRIGLRDRLQSEGGAAWSGL